MGRPLPKDLFWVRETTPYVGRYRKVVTGNHEGKETQVQNKYPREIGDN